MQAYYKNGKELKAFKKKISDTANNQRQSIFTFSQFTSKFIYNFTWFIIITVGSQLGPCTQRARREERQKPLQIVGGRF